MADGGGPARAPAQLADNVASTRAEIAAAKSSLRRLGAEVQDLPDDFDLDRRDFISRLCRAQSWPLLWELLDQGEYGRAQAAPRGIAYATGRRSSWRVGRRGSPRITTVSKG
jgi:hypothetical protein